ncbi:MAG: hypothetical protein ETSY2_53455 [Candidatus Entotheonella gemina]|uniref:DUF2845 domain-containing protein n=1 Tax=Candidatus Entotheonella gemina TaxID=1429439 RepID=W4L427_9BACT|nr:DUF2845 domain-containing protein [Candidatus Entotheonella palauensis]ETW92425.1 MAG: hypothetical protein ETSY2_53455 [Candidatus Entotheonella gemina]
MRAVAMVMILILMLSVGPAYALRCGTRIVSKGDHKTSVRIKCGEPEAIEERVIYRTLHLTHHPHGDKIVVPVAIEEWLYNFGPRRFMRQLWFENGKLVRIRSLGYGYLTR